MIRVYQNIPLKVGTTVTLDEEASRHLALVLRVKLQDSVILFNGQGGQFLASIVRLDKKTLTVQLQDFTNPHHESPLKITLAQCISRNDRMDDAIRKSVECGVYEIVPIISEHSSVQSLAQCEKKLVHWQKIIISACEQAGRCFIPKLATPQKLFHWLPYAQGLKLLAHPHQAKSLSRFREHPTQVTFLIGPEGGFSREELQAALQQNFSSVSFGPRIVRTETAPVVAISIAQYLWGDFKDSV